MGLLSVLNLPPPPRLARDKAAADQVKQALAAHIAQVKAHAQAGHPEANTMRTIVQAAGADAQKGLWESAKTRLEQLASLAKAGPDVAANATAGAPSPSQAGAPNAEAPPPELKLSLSGFMTDVKGLVDAGHAKADELAKIARAAAAELKKGAFGDAQKKIEQGRKLMGGDFRDGGKTASEVDPGPAEVSLQEFSDGIKKTIGHLTAARSVLVKFKLDDDGPSALGRSIEALGKVTDGLAAAKGMADKLLRVAAIARKLQECRDVLARVQGADFERNPVAAAEAMGDLARLFGEFGGQATREIPLLGGYFDLVSQLGKLWVPFAQMVERRKREAMEASENRDKPEAVPEPKSQRADTGRIVAFADLPQYLAEMRAKLTKEDSGVGRDVERIQENGTFGFRHHHGEMSRLLKGREGLASKARHAIGLGAAQERDEARRFEEHRQACLEIMEALQDRFRNAEGKGVTYLPAINAVKLVAAPGG